MDEDKTLGENKTCFIISPIGSKLEPIGSPGRARYEEATQMWEEVFLPATDAFGLTAVRSDKITDTGEIPDQIFTYLRDAEVVLADLSHANPNVMYELGLRHSQADKITIQVGEYGQLPFDVTTIRTTQFRRTSGGLIEARNELMEALRTALTGGGSPLRATTILATSTPMPQSEKEMDAVKSKSEDDAPERVTPGTLDVLAEGEESLTSLTTVLTRMTGTLGDIGSVTSDAAERFKTSDERKKGFAGRLLVARELADSLTPYTVALEADADVFYQNVTKMDVMVRYIIGRYDSGEESELEPGITFTRGILSLIKSAEDNAAGIVTFREGARKMRELARSLDSESKVLTRAADRILEGIALMGSWREPVEFTLATIEARIAGEQVA
jgi:hypothetical protein